MGAGDAGLQSEKSPLSVSPSSSASSEESWHSLTDSSCSSISVAKVLLFFNPLATGEKNVDCSKLCFGNIGEQSGELIWNMGGFWVLSLELGIEFIA